MNQPLLPLPTVLTRKDPRRQMSLFLIWAVECLKSNQRPVTHISEERTLTTEWWTTLSMSSSESTRRTCLEIKELFVGLELLVKEQNEPSQHLHKQTLKLILCLRASIS